MKFDGKLMEFKKNGNKLEKSLLGFLGVKQSGFNFGDVKEVMLKCPDYHSGIQLSKFENETNVVFYDTTNN
jgi:hypothetical protein